MARKNIGNLVIIGLIALNLTLWLVFPPQNDGRPAYWNQYAGEIFSTSAVLLMACGIFLSTRAHFLEPYFGGLDQMYVTHKNVAMTAVLLILAHFFTMTTTPNVQTSLTIGKLALIGLLLSAVLALAPRLPFWGRMIRLPYHVWRQIHRFTGLFFILGIFHFMGMDVLLIHKTPVVRAYVFPIVILGALVYLYKELLQGRIKKYFHYRVEQVERLHGSVVEVSLQPEQAKMPYRSGQFLFIGFPGERGLQEMHPFTISSAPGMEHLKLTIKSSGDFTSSLHASLREGMPARVDGSYGMFDYKTGGARQVWVAGGIGLTPFLSWVRDFPENLAFEIDFFYTVRTADEALFLEEFQNAAARCPGFRLHPVFSNSAGRVDAARIESQSGSLAGKDVYLCGPVALTEAITRQLASKGLPPGKIHFEEFNFR